MDIKQLEYFLAVCDTGSLNKAAACLYTTQPNVSRVISGFESELGRELFKRSHHGMMLTPYGNTIRQYAEGVLKHVKLITGAAGTGLRNKFAVASYRSDVVAKLLVDFYNRYMNKIVLEYYQGSLEEITGNVQKGICEIGIVYVAQKQMQLFSHILRHKNLRFKENINVGFAETEDFVCPFYTNSEAAILNLLNGTDLCLIGMGSKDKKYDEFGIRAIHVEGSENLLTVGYVYAEGQDLTPYAEEFIEQYSTTL